MPGKFCANLDLIQTVLSNFTNDFFTICEIVIGALSTGNKIEDGIWQEILTSRVLVLRAGSCRNFGSKGEMIGSVAQRSVLHQVH